MYYCEIPYSYKTTQDLKKSKIYLLVISIRRFNYNYRISQNCIVVLKQALTGRLGTQITKQIFRLNTVKFTFTIGEKEPLTWLQVWFACLYQFKNIIQTDHKWVSKVGSNVIQWVKQIYPNLHLLFTPNHHYCVLSDRVIVNVYPPCLTEQKRNLKQIYTNVFLALCVST